MGWDRVLYYVDGISATGMATLIPAPDIAKDADVDFRDFYRSQDSPHRQVSVDVHFGGRRPRENQWLRFHAGYPAEFVAPGDWELVPIAKNRARRRIRKSLLSEGAGRKGGSAATGPLDPVSLTVLDVGQGDSAIMTFGESETWLIDAAPGALSLVEGRFNHKFERQFFAPWRVGWVSHAHRDHIADFAELVERHYLDEVVVSANVEYSRSPLVIELLDTIERAPHVVKTVIEDCHRTRGHYTVVAVSHLHDEDDKNKHSILMGVTMGEHHAFFPGDMMAFKCTESMRSAFMEEWMPSSGQTLFYKVAHHGASSTVHTEFTDDHPGLTSVISCEMENDYRHPRCSTLWALGGGRIDRTDVCGTLGYELSMKGFELTGCAGNCGRTRRGPCEVGATKSRRAPRGAAKIECDWECWQICPTPVCGHSLA